MTIIVRVEMTAEEWQRIRILAIEQGKRPSQVMGEAVRTLLAKEAK